MKNMDSETGEWSLADRNIKEEEIFSQGIWEDMSRSILGVNKLWSRLSKILLGQIAAELNNLRARRILYLIYGPSSALLSPLGRFHLWIPNSPLP